MRYIFILILFVISVIVNAQEERKIIRQGNKAYKAEKYTESEEQYRKALEKKPKSLEADYNIGNALYKQKKYLDAANKYSSLTNSTNDKKELGYIYHNLGNSYLKAQKLNESIEAYKKALINNPTDKETKFNLAYAQRMLLQQQQQQQKDKQDQDKKDDKQQNNDQQNKDQQQNKKDEQQKQNEQEQQKNISQEDANRILEAMQNEEKELQKKLKMEKVRKEKGKTLKNW